MLFCLSRIPRELCSHCKKGLPPINSVIRTFYKKRCCAPHIPVFYELTVITWHLCQYPQEMNRSTKEAMHRIPLLRVNLLLSVRDQFQISHDAIDFFPGLIKTCSKVIGLRLDMMVIFLKHNLSSSTMMWRKKVPSRWSKKLSCR